MENNTSNTKPHYTLEQKKALMLILAANDFNILQSVKLYNEKYNAKLERRTVYDWIYKDEYFKGEYELRTFELLDECEKMHQLLRRGIAIKDDDGNIIAWQEKPDRQALEFYMKAKGRDRGYAEKLDLEVTGTTTIIVQEHEQAETIKNIISGLNNEK